MLHGIFSLVKHWEKVPSVLAAHLISMKYLLEMQGGTGGGWVES
jgi:hypothetical protein